MVVLMGLTLLATALTILGDICSSEFHEALSGTNQLPSSGVWQDPEPHLVSALSAVVCTAWAQSSYCPFLFLEASLSGICHGPDGQEIHLLATASLPGPQPVEKCGTFSAAAFQALWLSTPGSHLTQEGCGVPV